MKDWILRYAEQSSDDEEEEEEEEGKKKRNPELEEKFDPVSEYFFLYMLIHVFVQCCQIHINLFTVFSARNV